MQKKLFTLMAFWLLAAVHGLAAAQQEKPEPGGVAVETNDAGDRGDLVIRDGETVDRVAARDRDVVIEGRVEGDVLVAGGALTLAKGAKVGGKVVVIGGDVKDETGGRVEFVELDRAVLDALPSADTQRVEISIGPPAVAPTAPAPARPVSRRHEEESPVGGQVALLLLGLLGAGVLRLAAPRATQQVADTLSLETSRSFVVGLVAAFALTVVAVGNAAALSLPLVKVVWSPFGFVLASLIVFLAASGWVYGMKLAGDWVARRTGRHDGGSVYGRTALGMGAFFLANVALFGVSSFLGGLSLLAQALVAVTGLGAIVLTGFGRDPDWLSQRLRGDAGWFRRR